VPAHGLALLVLLAAAAAHWALRRAARRLPHVLARLTGGGAGARPVAPVPWQRAADLAVLVPMAALWLGTAHVLTGLLPPLAAARAQLPPLLARALHAPIFRLNDVPYAAIDLLALPALLALLWIAVGGATRLLRAQLQRLAGAERPGHDTLLLLVRGALMFLGTVVVLQVSGIDVSSLTLLASVLGLGIGFGLQNIANNFVSGIVIGFERPIQPGDFVQVGAFTGTVRRIGARSTEIRTLDRVSILVPNSRFLEHEVVNWSHGDPTTRLHVPVGVAYGSDIRRVRAALLDAARDHREILRDPRPRVEFRGFGESALDFELLAWTRDPQAQHRLTSDLNYRVEANLRRHGVQVPFPQRDLHLRSPALERVLAAWADGTGDGARAPSLPAAALPELPPEAGLDGDCDPRAWTDVELGALVGRMRGRGGLAIRDRRHLLTTYPQCFVGRDAVDWLVAAESLTRDEARGLGQRLLERGFLHHVLDEHGFEDGPYFYRFDADEGGGERRPEPPAA
jgi:small-conductance mechanosensitive channel